MQRRNDAHIGTRRAHLLRDVRTRFAGAFLGTALFASTVAPSVVASERATEEDRDLVALRGEVEEAIGNLEERLSAVATRDPSKVSHRVLAFGPEAADVKLLLRSVQAPTTAFPHPHLPLRAGLPYATTEAHHAQTTLLLVRSLGWDHGFEVEGTTYTLTDLAAGELFKADYCLHIPERARGLEEWVMERVGPFHQSGGEITKEWIEAVIAPHVSAFDASWLLELVVLQYARDGLSFDHPLQVGADQKKTVSLTELIDSQIQLWAFKRAYGRASFDYLFPVPEHGVHIYDMLSTVLVEFDDDPAFHPKAATYRNFLLEIFNYLTVDVPTYGMRDDYVFGVLGHLAEYVFGRANANPEALDLGTIDVVHPKTEGDALASRIVGNTILASEQISVREAFNASCHVLRGLREIEAFLRPAPDH